MTTALDQETAETEKEVSESSTGAEFTTIGPASAEITREEQARLGQEVTENMVRIQRWAGIVGTLAGPPLIIVDIDKAAEGLYHSGFMREWLVEQIKHHLLSGGTFINKCRNVRDDEMAIVSNGEALSMQVRSEYRMASQADVITYVDSVKLAEVAGKKVSARSQSKTYSLHFHEGVELIQAYERLPRQARTILDLLNETGRDQFSEAAIQVIMTQNVERLSTTQLVERIFGFYRHRFIEEGHLKET